MNWAGLGVGVGVGVNVKVCVGVGVGVGLGVGVWVGVGVSDYLLFFSLALFSPGTVLLSPSHLTKKTPT